MAKVIGTIKPIKDKVIVHNMHFGEQKSSGGIVILGDDGKDRGIYPRWGQVLAKGTDNTEPFDVGDWLLIEHGRWTRGIQYENEDGTDTVIRMIDNNAVLMWSKEAPGESVSIAKTIDVPLAVEAYRLENKQ
jgi:co-chaperonin GroES (HSP10)